MTGFGGLLFGIPGSVGGAVFMNAGAYGGEISHILQSWMVLTKDGEIETLSAEFGFWLPPLNHSGSGAVVLSAKFTS